MAIQPELENDLNALKIPPELRGGASAPGRAKGRRWAWIAAAVVALIAGFAFWSVRSAAIPVQIDRAQASSADALAAATTLVASGYVVPHHQVEVGTKVMGKVAWIGVEKGDRVKTGQLLVRLEDDEYRAQVDRARGALATAQANYDMLKTGSRPEEVARDLATLENARANYDRTRGLAAAGVVSQQDLDDAKSRYETALNTYQITKIGPRQEQIDQGAAAITQARGDLAYAQTQLDATRITAPVDGTILDRVVEKGELVTTMFTGDRGAKSYVVSLADLNDIRVELDVNENDFARVSMNQPCDIVLEAYPGRHYPGQVIEISPQANRDKGTIQVKVQFLKSDNLVRPEMLARVSFEQPPAAKSPASASSAAPVVTIPRTARVTRGGRDAVFVVESGRARLVPVEISDPGGDRLVVAQGLRGGEQIVVNAPEALADGAAVKPAAAAAP